MGSHRPPRRLVLFSALSIAAAGAAFFVAAGTSGSASAAEPLIADSVCKAHELKALKAADPSLEIEIPEEFNRDFPTADACASHAAALDPDPATGAVQPIPFSHKHHAGTWKIDCQYCHSGTDQSRAAGVPSVELCMGCHAQFPGEYDELSGIQTLKEHWRTGKTIEWTQIHRLPEHVKFQHQAHVRRTDLGIQCQTCHGPVETMEKVMLTPDTKWWPWGLPTQKLEMGWCVQCHRDNGASQDCLTCHY
jgi:Cytochrome c7 and related cytochrome c